MSEVRTTFNLNDFGGEQKYNTQPPETKPAAVANKTEYNKSRYKKLFKQESVLKPGVDPWKASSSRY